MAVVSFILSFHELFMNCFSERRQISKDVLQFVEFVVIIGFFLTRFRNACWVFQMIFAVCQLKLQRRTKEAASFFFFFFDGCFRFIYSDAINFIAEVFVVSVLC